MIKEKKNEIKEHACQRCGLCCHSFGITLTIEDLNREPRLYQYSIPTEEVGNMKTRLFMQQNNMPFVVDKGGRGLPCPFFANKSCLIYETRPQICRDYPGRGLCKRREKELLCQQ